jgi:ABC-2 type transport system ATP-binding protein
VSIVISVNNLTKYYSNKCAVKNVSFAIEQGEIFGLLGPNGAGKTTIIKMLTTLSRPTKGNVVINGMDASVNSEDIKSHIALVPQERNFDRELTVYENMLVYGMLYNIPDFHRNIADKLSMLGLTEEKDTIAEHLSGGMQRRLLIARALLSNPEIIFLDEPTIGLDPIIRREIWDIVRGLKESGKTIFMTTHYMEEAEVLCDRVAFISKGRVVTIGSPEELKNNKGRYVMEKKNGDGRTSRIFYNHRYEAEEIVRLSNNGAIVRKTNLEDIFIELTRDEINERG